MSRSLLSRKLVSRFVQGKLRSPQGLKPAFLLATSGTAEAVPFPKRFIPFPKLFALFSELFARCSKISVQGVLVLGLVAGVAAGQNSPPTGYGESFRKGT